MRRGGRSVIRPRIGQPRTLPSGALRGRISATGAPSGKGQALGQAHGAVHATASLAGVLETPETTLTHRRILTPLGEEMRDSLPPVLRESPDYLAIIHAIAKECELAVAAIETVRRQFNPAHADLLLGVWERITRQTVNPPLTIAERQAAVTARLRKMLTIGEGSAWEEQVSAIVGIGWSYEEHIPGEPASPPAGTLRITLPFPPEGSRYAEALLRIREVTPAHLKIEFASASGFLLDESLMDLEEMTI